MFLITWTRRNIDIATYDFVMAEVASTSFLFLTTDTVIPLMTCMTERLLVLYPSGERINYLSCFMKDMDWMIDTMDFCLDNRREPALGHDLEQDEYEIACQKLRDAAYLTQKRAVPTLSLQATPILVYLTEYRSPFDPISIYDLFAFPGNTVADVLYTLEQHRDIIHLTLDRHDRRDWRIYTITVTDNDFFYQENGEDKEWRTEGKWRDLRIFLLVDL